MLKNVLPVEPTLLTTKLNIPQPRARFVPRPHLVARLSDGATRPLVLICAPAGFGKTTLLAEWIPQSEKCVCWVSLDDGDNDLVHFWSYVIAALQMLRSTLGQSAQALLEAARLRRGRSSPRRQPAQVEPFLTALLNDLAGFPDHFCLVLDDYHAIENMTIHRELALLLGRMPPQMHVIITSRSDPPLPPPVTAPPLHAGASLARLRARDQLLELRAADLRFSVDEAAAFLGQVMGLSLPAEDVAALEKCTEGWVAGLQLAALSLRGQEDMRAFIADFGGEDRFILEYLTEEVLQRQPEPVQEFLLKTSILERLSGPLCDAVTGRSTPASPDGAAFLDLLERANLFIVPLDNKRTWYRYHPLFADLLRGHLAQAMPQGVPVLHARASTWLEQHGLVDEAVSHALAAGDAPRIARLLERSARAMLFARFEPVSLLGWLAALPAGCIDSRPALGLAEAWARVMIGQRKAAHERLAVVDSACASLPDAERRAMVGEIAAVRATMAVPEADAPSIQAQAQLALSSLPEADLLMRAIGYNLLGIGQRYAGNALAAQEAFTDAVRLSKLSGDAVTMRMSTGWIANVLAEQGRLREAAEAHRQVEELPGVAPALGEVYIGAGAVLREWNELAAATRWIDRGMELAAQGDLHLITMDGHVGLARVAQARDDPADALARIDLALDLGRKHNQPLRNGQLLAWRARLQLMQGDLAAALRWARASGLAVHDPVLYSQEDVYLTLARVLIGQARQNRRSDDLPGVRQMLEQVLRAAQTGGRMNRVLEILLLRALAADVQAYPAQARESLDQALVLAEPENYLRIWLDEGSPMASLLERHRDSLRSLSQKAPPYLTGQSEPQTGRAGASSDPRLLPYVDRLLAGFQTEMTASKPLHQPVSSGALPAGVEPLTSHELAVLRLLAAGLSAPQIAEKYVLSINTIKTQIKSIYAKLGVHSRAEALAAASELHLL